MPLSLAKIANNTASVTLTFGGESATVMYYPSRVTEKTYAQLQALTEINESNLEVSFAGLNDMLSHLVKSWDVYEDDEQTVMFPLDAGRLAELPIMFRMQVISTIMGDIRPEVMTPQSLNGKI